MNQIYNFEEIEPPKLTERELQVQLEARKKYRQLRRQVLLLEIASVFTVLALVLLVVYFSNRPDSALWMVCSIFLLGVVLVESGILAVAILVPVLLCVLLGVFSFRASDSVSTDITYSASSTWIESMTVEDIQDLSTSVDVKAWIQACDEASREDEENGTGMHVYVLRAAEEGSENTTTRYLVYRNDGYRIVSAETEEKGWWNSARELVLEYTEAEEDDLGYDLLYYEITSDKTYSLSIYSDSESTAYSIEDVDELVIRYDGLTIDVTIGKDAGNVASVACTFYVEDEAWQTDVTESAHGDSLTNTSLSFYYETPIHDGITSFYLEFYDEDGNLLLGKLVELDVEAETGGNFTEEEADTETEDSGIEDIDESSGSDVGGGQTWMFWVSADDNGNLVLRQLQ